MAVLAGAAHCGPVPSRMLEPRWTVLLPAVQHGPRRSVRTTLPQPWVSAAPDTGRLPVVHKRVRCPRPDRRCPPAASTRARLTRADEQARTAGSGRRAETATAFVRSPAAAASTADTAAGRAVSE
jgi:hypothetical protein